MFELQIQLFILLTIGYVVGKKEILDSGARGQLTDLIIKVILPCSIIMSFQMKLSSEVIRETFQVILAAFAIQIIYLALNLFLWRSFPEEEAVSCKYATMVTNASFIGLPIAASLYGTEGLLYASVFVIPQRIMMWAYGLPLYTGKSEKNIVKKILFHPCVFSILLGMCLMVFYSTGYPIPGVIAASMKTLSSCATALCMLVIGSIMSEMKLKELFDGYALYYSIFRLILIPLFIFLLLRLWPMGEISRGICVLLTAMPAPTTVVILAQQYGRKPAFASRLLFISTLGSMLSLPLIVNLIFIF